MWVICLESVTEEWAECMCTQTINPFPAKEFVLLMQVFLLFFIILFWLKEKKVLSQPEMFFS